MSPVAITIGVILGGAIWLLPGVRLPVRLAAGIMVLLGTGLGVPAVTQHARRRAEAPVIENLYLIAIKEESFRLAAVLDQDQDGRGEYGPLGHLYRTRPPLIHEPLAAGEEFGYHYYVILGGTADEAEAEFFAYAIPLRYGVTGRRSVYVDQTGVVRIADVGPLAFVTPTMAGTWPAAPLPEGL